ncbi:MAG: hypothetical protein WCD35_15230 [Mycobacteriales bacterium]
MTEPPQGWSAPGGEQPPPPDSAPSPAGYGPPPPGYGPPPPGYGVPQSQQQPPQQWTQGWGQQWYGGPPPAPVPGVVPLRPLGLGELLDGAIKIIRRYPRPTLGLSAVIAVVVTVVNVLFVVLSGPQVDTTSGTDAQFNVAFGNAAASGPGSVVSYLAGLVLTGVLVVVVGKGVLGQATTTSEVWASVRPRIWALLGLSLLTGLLVALPAAVGILLGVLLGFAAGGIGIFLGILLGAIGVAGTVYLYTRLVLAPAALVLEHAGVTTALRRSGVLVRGAWWRTFWVLVLTSIITGVLSGVIALPVTLAALLIGGTGGVGFHIATQVAAGLVSVVVAPFASGVRALLYVDRRMRAEGLDVGLQAAAAASPTA